MGQDPEDILTDEEIEKLLNATFKKFDKDGSNRIEEKEFIQAWKFLGLQGSEQEISRSFRQVDVDSSGYLDRREFSDAVRNSRNEELSLALLLGQMDGHLEGLEGFFNDYKKRLE